MLHQIAKRAAKKRYSMITNPCVPGDTMILTDQGHVRIDSVVGQKISVWNGIEFSEVEPFSTGVNPTVTVKFSDGTSLRCTPYHKFVLQHGWTRGGNQSRVEAKDLQIGDRLAKFTMPVVSAGTSYGTADEAYSQGFYAGDGTTDYDWSWIYGPKYPCANRLIGTFGPVDDGNDRRRWDHGPMRPKNWVPVDGNLEYCLNWLAGFLDADGTTLADFRGGQTGVSIQAGSVDRDFLLQIRLMLTRLGVQAVVARSHEAGRKPMPNGRGGVQEYDCQDFWRLTINNFDTYHLHEVGLPTARLDIFGSVPQRSAKRFVEIVSIVEDEPCETFCFNEPKNHTGTFNGIVTGQCGEISLAVWGGYCVIADIVPFHADDLDQAQDAFEYAARALIRVNTMDNLYSPETKRTNRIGVGMTGVHEFAWKFFHVGFRDLVNPDFDQYHDFSASYEPHVITMQVVKDALTLDNPRIRAAAFWEFLGHCSRSTMRAAFAYSDKLGLNRPHTVTTIKPAGTTSKLFGLTEGWHLPALAHYVRWVQFREDDPLVDQYEAEGYPVRRDLKTYKGHAIVGFPTEPTIASLGMGEELVLAGDASAEDQYEWLRLGEFFWIEGGSVFDMVEHGGVPRPLEERHGNQISYTLKYKPTETSFWSFQQVLKSNQLSVRCCSVMPQVSMDSSAYEYLPEEQTTKAEYEAMMRAIHSTMAEDIGREHVDCDGGACPVDFREEKVA
jgi:hypothetical protein